MSEWMRTEYVFNDHSAILTLTAKGGMGKSLHEFLAAKPEPEVLAAFVSTLILDARPELAGMVLYFMRYDPSIHCWEFGVIHGSLPMRTLASEAQRIPLYVEER